MLAPLMNNAQKAAVSKSKSIQAPVKGWNAKDALADMTSGYAVALENYFPRESDVILRNGHSVHATGVGSGAVNTVMEYAGPTVQKLFAASDTVIYDATSAGAASSSVTGLTNGKWQHTMFSTSGGNFLFIVNGADAPRYFDGSSWTTPSLTGVTATTIVGVTSHQRRLFFTFNNSTSFGYLAVTSVAGAVSTFDLGSLMKKGGYLVACGSWTRDGGDGSSDDIFAAITSEGEVILYSGNDPGTASTWSLIGRFDIGRPLGRRCMFKVGADLVVLTQDGAVPLSQVLGTDRVQVQTKATSGNIQNAWIAAARTYGANFGWQCLLYPQGQYALFNVPITSSKAHQYVVNSETGAWCKFTGQNFASWTLYDGNLYGGAQAGGKVFLADDGASDNTANIEGLIKPAFDYFGRRGIRKLFTMCRPLFRANGPLAIAIDLNVDFSDLTPTSVPTSPAIDAALWDTALWDTATWSDEDAVLAPPITVYGIGDCAAPVIRCSTNSIGNRLSAFDMVWQEGGFL